MDPTELSYEQYLVLKQEVNKLYDAMMKLHRAKARGVEYANMRQAYMEKKNWMQQVLQAHPEYLQDS